MLAQFTKPFRPRFVLSRLRSSLVPCLWLAIAAVAGHCSAADDAELASRCRQLLQRTVVDFYLPACLDHEHGGYLEILDDEGQFAPSEKFLTLQARQCWFFSTLAIHGIRRDEALAAADSGYKFLRSYFYDADHGGYYAKTARNGQPVDQRKHVYPNAFVIYALVEFHRATGRGEPLEQALELFHTLERHCHDRQHGGYQEFFTADWTLITDPSESGYVGAVNTKTYNSHLHLLEAFAQLYRATQDVQVERRLVELLQINTLTVQHPDFNCNIDAWHPDWTMIQTERNLRASYGHDVECAWLVLDAADALGQKPAILRNWSTSIVEHAIRYGWDAEHGGFYYTGPLGQLSDDRKKEWWTQAEALVSMLTMHRFTGDPRYRELFEQTLDFVERHQVSPLGGWIATVNADGSLRDRSIRTSMWQGAYHNGRALLLCEKLLRSAR
jgi:mannobiose 2-epimerase